MQKNNMQNSKTNNGITLIALVITIIVMLILVAVTISMAVNGGLFDYAGKAVGETQNAIKQEQQFIDDIIDQYFNESSTGNGGTAGGEEKEEDIVGIDGEIFTAIYTETKEYKDKNNDVAMIPKGFSVGKSEGINTIDDGLVIQDAKGNQFVWIPVTYTATETLDSNWLDTGFLEVFKRSSTLTSYTEPYADGYEGEDTEYYEMMLSVQENKGFYIGRFEAGTEEARYIGVANGTDKLVVKRDVYPYNFVAWGKSTSDYVNIIKYDFDNWKVNDETGLDQGHGAVYLSKHLLDGQTTGATSTLCYGVQWDAMLNFISDKFDINDSEEWGNYHYKEYTITRPTAKYAALNGDTRLLEEWTPIPEGGKGKTSSEYMLLTTGASDEFEAKNIYDVAGNEEEWTMEFFSLAPYAIDRRVVRGGLFTYEAAFRSASSRSESSPFTCYNAYSFRCALYIK